MIVRSTTGTKGMALKFLAQHYGCTVDECVVVGDWLNDIPMFTVAGFAFAMGQAPDEVRKMATDGQAGKLPTEAVERAVQQHPLSKTFQVVLFLLGRMPEVNHRVNELMLAKGILTPMMKTLMMTALVIGVVHVHPG